MFYLSIAAIAFLLAFITQIAASSMAIHWAVDTFIIFPHAFPFEIAFGLSIPISFASVVVFALLLIDSKSDLYLYLLASLVFTNSILLIGISSPPSLTSWIRTWDQQWTNTSHSMSFQLEKSCCGWNDFQDRSILECPFLSRSGCRPVVEDWINWRFQQIFQIELLIGSISLYSMFSFFWARYHHHIETIWAEIELPLLQSNMYQ
ncbi:hypothetical protein TRFO_07260 [Tritrichomonas foetus]|uniref:Tetraspanin family protein n=1 Tax=Tritrichomonas foetus TaxID=1144522 RepID=A0A1J4JSG7_9EUKA|nr:hypothetical protein TRFO_07260 [Tritrichomonas foetus]|eukprot:OHT02079.1 hypothetical protein TRFO_07260 [Tritrichomonas foetus]